MDETLSWQELVRGEFEYHLVPGRHLTMVESPNVRVLAEKLSKLLEDLA